VLAEATNFLTCDPVLAETTSFLTCDPVLAETTSFLTCEAVLAEATIFFTDKNGWAPMYTDGMTPRHRAHPVRLGVEGRHGCTTLFDRAPIVRLSPALGTGDPCASVPIHSYR
jgi:hypothetical protein